VKIRSVFYGLKPKNVFASWMIESYSLRLGLSGLPPSIKVPPMTPMSCGAKPAKVKNEFLL